LNTKAFTMMELVIVLIVTGILAAVMIPRIERDNLHTAAMQVVRHIRYTQHLAMVDDVYDTGDGQWFRKYWKIAFRTAKNCYTVYSDTDKDYLNDANESAIEPMTKVRLYADNNCQHNTLNNDALLLEESYGVDSITLGIPAGLTSNLSDCNTNTKKYIAFDHFGRPHTSVTNAVSGIMKNPCMITLRSGTRSATVKIMPQTGYVKLESIN